MTWWTLSRRHWWLGSNESVRVRTEAEATARGWARVQSKWRCGRSRVPFGCRTKEPGLVTGTSGGRETPG